MSEDCFLHEYTNCGGGDSNSGGGLINVGAERLRKASLARGDNLYEVIANQVCETYKCHKNCSSTYTSKHHIKRLQKERKSTEPTPKRSRRSTESVFNFKEHCLFCGKTCLPLDPKNPKRWRRVVTCRTADRGKGQQTFRDSILQTCRERNDAWAQDVQERVLHAVSDLHAADAQYHKDCLSSFSSNLPNVSMRDKVPEDEAFNEVVKNLLDDETRIWNSNEVYKLYQSFHGCELTRRSLTDRIAETLPEILVLSGVGVANILVFRKYASSKLKAELNDDGENDIVPFVKKVARTIARECTELKRDHSTYDTRISVEDALQGCSPTLLMMLSYISSKFDHSLKAAMVGSINTSCIVSKPSTLQIALGIMVNDKSVIEILHEFGVTTTYDEVLCFKTSAAHAAAKNMEQMGIRDSNKGLVQVVADHFDATISSPNGLKSTHALAILVTQTQNPGADKEIDQKIKRLKKSEMAADLPDMPVHQYEGPKKPNMPTHAAQSSPLPLKLLVHQAISLS